MGINGLHPVIKPYCLPCHISELAGHRVGVDAWSWLHRGAVGAARDLALGQRPWEARGFDPPWVEFCLKMARVLQAAAVTPVLVFDGCRLPAKAATNQQRRQRRAEARERAQRLLAEGREQEAQGALAQCVDVTAEMAHETVLRLRERGVEFVVAPYEADPQLAHLSATPEREGGVAAIVTEDSDLVAYGCRRVLFKMDTTGHCLELALDRLFAGPEGARAEPGGGGGGGVLSLRGWSLDMLQAACVLAGCDFAPSLKGISFRTAAALVARRRGLEPTLRLLRAEKRWQLAATPEYCAAARRAALAFKHALVFCANTGGGACRRLTPPPAGDGGAPPDLAHLGAELPPGVARGLAYGHLHPHTLQPFAPAPRGGPQQRPQGRQQGQQGRQQGQHTRPSIASGRQLGSWLASGAAHPAAARPGLGPSQAVLPAPPPPAGARQQQQQWGRGTDGVDVSDIVALCAPLPAAAPGSQHPAHRSGAGGVPGRFAPQPQAQPPAAPAPEPQPHGSFRRPVGAPAAAWGAGVTAGLEGEEPAEEPCGSWEEAATAVVVPAGGGSQAPPQPRAAMRPLTNLPPASQLAPASQQHSCHAPECGGAAPESQQPERAWDRGEQYRPPPAAAGSKRRASGGRGGGAAKRGASKPLAPPAQRISRFFAAAPRPAGQ